MAEALLKLALPKSSPWRVASAGLAACAGSRASEGAVAALAEMGGDLRAHRSQPVSPELVQEAAAIIVMTDGHLQQLCAQYPASRDKFFLLRDFDPGSPSRGSVADPFCGSLDDYRQCRDLIRMAIPGLVRFLAQTPSAPSC
jgi:protein-tyrosine phosphatase